MPVFSTAGLARLEDGVLQIGLEPPTNVGGWNIRFRVAKRFGASISGVLYDAWVGAGLNGQSGIYITDSGQGKFQIPLPSVLSSGIDPVNLAYAADRMTSGLGVSGPGLLSGSRTALAAGFLILSPSID